MSGRVAPCRRVTSWSQATDGLPTLLGALHASRLNRHSPDGQPNRPSSGEVISDPAALATVRAPGRSGKSGMSRPDPSCAQCPPIRGVQWPEGDARCSRRGDPDAGRGVHRLEQVSGQVAQRAIKHGDGLRRERKPRVGITDNRTDGHVICCLMQVNAPDNAAIRAACAVVRLMARNLPDGQITSRFSKPVVHLLAQKYSA